MSKSFHGLGVWNMHHLKRNGGDDEVNVPTLLARLHLTLQPPQPWVEGVPWILIVLKKNKYINAFGHDCPRFRLIFRLFTEFSIKT